VDYKNNKTRKSKLLLGIALAIFMICPNYYGQVKQKSLAVFPVGLNESVFSPEGFSLEDYATKLQTDALKTDKRFSSNPFTRTHPSVARALSEGSIKAQMLVPPFTGKSEGEFRAVRIGRLMRAELAIASVIDSYDFDNAKNTAKGLILVELYDVRLGKLIGSVAFSASGSGTDEISAAKKMVEALVGGAIPQALAILANPPKTGGG